MLEQNDTAKNLFENEMALEKARNERLKAEIVRLQTTKALVDVQPRMILPEHKLFIKSNFSQLSSNEKAGLADFLQELITEEQRRIGQFQFNLDLLSEELGARVHAYVSKCLRNQITLKEPIDAFLESLSLVRWPASQEKTALLLRRMKLHEEKRRALTKFSNTD